MASGIIPNAYDNYIFNTDFSNGEVITAINDKIQPLVNGEVDYYTSVISLENYSKIALFGGSFCPYHYGHIGIKELAEKILNMPVLLELSLRNSDKGMVDYIDINERLEYIKGNHYILTAAPLIRDKVNLIKKYNPNCEITFIVGADTWTRIWDAKYKIPLDELYRFFKSNKVKFLVFGRNGVKLDMSRFYDLIIPSEEAANFNMPISSTELRKNKI